MHYFHPIGEFSLEQSGKNNYRLNDEASFAY